MNASFLKISALQLENRALKEKLLAFQSGARYVRMKEDYEAIIRSKDRRIRELAGKRTGEKAQGKPQNDRDMDAGK